MNTVRRYISHHFPTFYSALLSLKRRWYAFGSVEHIFSRVYRKKLWRSESRSGPGSTLAHTKLIIKEVSNLIRKINAKTVLDIGCGDFNWMKHIEIEMYIGVDVVEELIVLNTKNFGSSRRKFVKLDITRDKLPKVDLILCRDCLVHLSFDDIFLVLRNIKESNSQYLLTTTFASGVENRDIYTGEWRPLNLKRPPFNFPRAVEIINESCPLAEYSDKSLGLWRISDIIDSVR